MKFTLTLLILLSATNQLCRAQSGYSYTQPMELEDGWKTSNLHSTAVDTSRLYSFFNQMMQVDHKLNSVLLIKDDQLIIEEYFNGYDVNALHDLRSVTKSIKSILLGIAIDNGIIDNINDPISKYLKSHEPEKSLDDRKDEITIRHLITMSTGWDCNDWDRKSKGQEDRVYKKDDWIQYTLDLPMINNPGEISTYCSMGVIIMAEIISQASGLSLIEFAEQHLFSPLEIADVMWGHTSNKDVISSANRLYLKPRDAAKIGQLILNKGIWNGNQIVSPEWIEVATSKKTTISGTPYGYLWWMIPFKVNERIINSITATGNGGQYIMVIPELDMVGIFTGGYYNSEEDKLAFAIMNNVLIPTFLDNNDTNQD